MMKRSILMTVAALVCAVQAWGANKWCTSWANVKTYLERGDDASLKQDITFDTSTGIVRPANGTTLNLNGHTITYTGGNYRLFEVTNSVSFAIDGSPQWEPMGPQGTIKGASSSTKASGMSGALAYVNGGTLSVYSSVYFLNMNTAYGGGVVYVGSGVLNFAAHVTSCKADQSGGAICGVGGTINITGGSFTSCSTSASGGAIYIGSAKVTMTDCTISNCSAASEGGAVYVNSDGTFTMNGGVLTGNKANGSATAVSALFAGWGTKTVNGGVSDSSLIGDNKASGMSCTQVGSLYVVGRNVSVSSSKLAGGTFTFDPSATIYTSAGLNRLSTCTVTIDTSATPTWYTLKSANVASAPSWRDVKANLEAGNSVKLTQSISQGTTVGASFSGKTVTLDLNGYTITGSSQTSWEYRLAKLSSGASLTLTDGSSGRTGKIDGNNVSRSGSGSCVYVSSGCTLTINGGTITKYKTTTSGGAVYNVGTVTMNGGTISSCTATSNGGAFYNTGTFTMNGGVLTGNTANGSSTSASAIIYNTGTATVNGGVSDNSHIGDFMASGKECKLVGSKYIVGTGIASDANNKLIAGTYTFCPTNAEYAAAGVALVSGSSTQKTGDLAWQIVSGTSAGDNVMAYLADGVCTIHGTGATAIENPLSAQWASVKDVRIAGGVTSLGRDFFYKFYNLTNVTIAASCTSLGDGALFRCLSLEQVTFEGDTLPTLGENALPVRTAIKMEGGKPVVTMVPKVIVGGSEPTLKGSNDLSNWENVTAGNEGDYHFFKYVIGE